MILGCDAAGVDADGNEVVLHLVIGPTGHGVGPGEPCSILTEHYQVTFAEQVAVPAWNVLPKPKELSLEEAACVFASHKAGSVCPVRDCSARWSCPSTRNGSPSGW